MRRIDWVKWRDPFRHIDRRIELDEGEDYFDLERSRYSFGMMPEHGDDVGMGVVGPWGVVPLHESTIPSRVFNFWVGHANFTITSALKDVIKWTPGIESFNILTPYRFRVAIAQAFDEKEVKENVIRNLNPEPPTRTKGRSQTLVKVARGE